MQTVRGFAPPLVKQPLVSPLPVTAVIDAPPNVIATAVAVPIWKPAHPMAEVALTLIEPVTVQVPLDVQDCGDEAPVPLPSNFTSAATAPQLTEGSKRTTAANTRKKTMA